MFEEEKCRTQSHYREFEGRSDEEDPSLGAALNVSSHNLGQIGVEDSMIRPNGMMVCAFDSTKTSACGEIDLKILFGVLQI